MADITRIAMIVFFLIVEVLNVVHTDIKQSMKAMIRDQRCS
jgi:hypothetical protein